MRRAKLHGWVGLLLAAWLPAGAAAWLPFEQVQVGPADTLGAVLDQVAAQTGLRFNRPPAGLPASSLTATGSFVGVLAQLAQSSGALIRREGAFDYAVWPAPTLAVRALPSCPLGPLTLTVSLAWQREAPAPWYLVADLRCAAASELELASLANLDPLSVRLTAGGQAVRFRAQEYHAPDVKARRTGFRLRLAFDAPPDPRQPLELSGELLCFAEVRPVTFRWPAETPGTQAQDPLSAELRPARRFGDLWTTDVVITRPLVLGDDGPWLDAVLQASDDRLYRPLEPSCAPAPADGEDRLASAHHLTFRLPAPPLGTPDGPRVEPRLLTATFLDRRRPYERQRFVVSGIAVPPLPPTAAEGKPLWP